jgi:hypothetical protein
MSNFIATKGFSMGSITWKKAVKFHDLHSFNEMQEYMNFDTWYILQSILNNFSLKCSESLKICNEIHKPV